MGFWKKIRGTLWNPKALKSDLTACSGFSWGNAAVGHLYPVGVRRVSLRQVVSKTAAVFGFIPLLSFGVCSARFLLWKVADR